LEGSEDEEDEGERMTVPLQPFNHAVGGHSSIYKFTRRAVCKVSARTGGRASARASGGNESSSDMSEQAIRATCASKRVKSC
jgi:hypothetical protein